MPGARPNPTPEGIVSSVNPFRFCYSEGAEVSIFTFKLSLKVYYGSKKLNRSEATKAAWVKVKAAPERYKARCEALSRGRVKISTGTRKGVKMPPFSEEHRLALSQPCKLGCKCKKHSLCNPWNKGHKLELNRQALAQWRKLVFQLNDRVCRVCGRRGGKLEADHIISKWTDVSLIYVVNNGRILCHDCHKQTDTYAGRAQCSLREMQLPLPLVVI